MSVSKIASLHANGFVILQANRSTNAPIGWKRKGSGKTKWGYVDEMEDPDLKVYNKTFNPKLIAQSHCGFYLGHNMLCCIDLDTKKTTIEQTTKLKNSIVKKLGVKVAVETTKSKGYHIYFRYEAQPNRPDYMGLKVDNWIELYYSKRFIACYLSHTKQYELIHGEVSELPVLTKQQHKTLLGILKPFEGTVTTKKKKRKPKEPIDEQTKREIDNYVSQIVDQGIDITGDNPKWFRIGKALANALGDEGFERFNVISQFSATYNADTIGDVYNRFFEDDKRSRDSKVTIATFFKYCEEAGLYDMKTLKVVNKRTEEAEFDLPIGKKDSYGDKVHILCKCFIDTVPIVTLDKKTYYVYHGTHWTKRNERQVVELLAEFIHRSNVIPSVARQLQTLPYMELSLREIALRTMVDEIQPNTGDLYTGVNINMQNGILHIDLKNGKRKLIDHAAEYNFTGILPYDYLPAASCPRFTNWLNTQVPDEEQRVAYYAFVASCLTKHKSDIIMMLAGPTATGKSSLIDVTRRLIGMDNTVAISAGTLFGGGTDAQTQAMQMENKLLAYDFDAQPFKSLEMLLKVAAQEPIQGWQMNVARRPVTNYGRVILAMNPYNYSVFTPAVARRFITINMDVPIIKDNSIMPAIYENELPGIMNNVLNIGMRHLIENGGQISVSSKMKQATTDFHVGSRDSIRWFKQNYGVPTKSNDKSNRKTLQQKLIAANPKVELVRTSVSELYRQFRIWCEDVEGYPAGRIPLRKHFAQDLELIDIKDSKEAETNSYVTYVTKEKE